MSSASPPRENLVRALRPAVEVRADGEGGMPTLAGYFSVFNSWTEINSAWEGNFLERVAPGAFKKTFKENKGRMRALFQHGQDPQVADKPLGPIKELREDDKGAYYEVELMDTSYNRDLLPGLEAGLYGASFRFRVVREDIVERPEPSAYNPRGLPERTVREAQVMEFGPVTFPAYADATAGVRSMTDEFIVARLARDPSILERLRAAVESAPLENEERDDDEAASAAPVAEPSSEDLEPDQAEAQDEPTSDTPDVPETAPEAPETEDEPVTEPDTPHDPAPSDPDADRSVTSGVSAADPDLWIRGHKPAKAKRKGWL